MAEEYYGQSGSSSSSDLKTVQERCREYYELSDFVVVMNIDSQPFTYQVQRPENMSFDQPDAVSMNTLMLKPPERITLKPSETRLCPAYEADIMIKNLMDKMVYSRRGSLIAEAKANGDDNVNIKESVSDPETQHRYIKEIYQGKKDFLNDYNKTLETPDVSKDLEDDESTATEALRGPGRPKKQVA